MYYYDSFYSPFHMFGFGFIFMILFWALIVYGVVLLVRHWSNSHKGHPGRGSSAQDILKERYAKGEITKEQFESIKKDIQ